MMYSTYGKSVFAVFAAKGQLKPNDEETQDL